MDPIDTGPHYSKPEYARLHYATTHLGADKSVEMMEDFDALDPVPGGAILTENKVEVSVDAEPELVGKSGTASTEKLGIEPAWRLTWKYGTMDLIPAWRSEAEARSSAALFIKLWKRLDGWSPGLLRDMAVIYVGRCFRVQEMNLVSKEFLAEIAKLDAPETVNAAYSKIYQEINKLMWAGKFEQIDFMLRDFKGTTSAALAFLGFTNCIKNALRCREGLYKRTYAAAVKFEGEEKANREFRGLE